MIGNIDILVKELCKLPKEVGWVEFKHNNCEPSMIKESRIPAPIQISIIASVLRSNVSNHPILSVDQPQN